MSNTEWFLCIVILVLLIYIFVKSSKKDVPKYAGELYVCRHQKERPDIYADFYEDCINNILASEKQYDDVRFLVKIIDDD